MRPWLSPRGAHAGLFLDLLGWRRRSLASWPLGKGSRATPMERNCPRARRAGRQAGRVGLTGALGQDVG